MNRRTKLLLLAVVCCVVGYKTANQSPDQLFKAEESRFYGSGWFSESECDGGTNACGSSDNIPSTPCQLVTMRSLAPIRKRIRHADQIGACPEWRCPR